MTGTIWSKGTYAINEDGHLLQCRLGEETGLPTFFNKNTKDSQHGSIGLIPYFVQEGDIYLVKFHDGNFRKARCILVMLNVNGVICARFLSLPRNNTMKQEKKMLMHADMTGENAGENILELNENDR